MQRNLRTLVMVSVLAGACLAFGATSARAQGFSFGVSVPGFSLGVGNGYGYGYGYYPGAYYPGYPVVSPGPVVVGGVGPVLVPRRVVVPRAVYVPPPVLVPRRYGWYRPYRYYRGW
jgi:hypothetical protein